MSIPDEMVERADRAYFNHTDPDKRDIYTLPVAIRVNQD